MSEENKMEEEMTNEIVISPENQNKIAQIYGNIQLFQTLEKMAELMSNSGCAVPVWLRNNKGGCFSIVLQAWVTGCNPFGLAGDSFSVNGGVASYGAKSVHAMIKRATCGDFQKEYFGDWDKILGKFKKITGRNEKEYIAPAWDPKDEEGLGITVWHESDPSKKTTIFLKQCAVRNSTNWAINPKLQIFYYACKVWSREYRPEIIMGIYSVDEMPEYNEMPNATPEQDKTTAKGTSALKEKMKRKKESTIVDAEEVKPETFRDKFVAYLNVNGAPISEDDAVKFLRSKKALQDNQTLADFEQMPSEWREYCSNNMSDFVNQIFAASELI